MCVCVCVCVCVCACVCVRACVHACKAHMNMFFDNYNKPLLFLCRSKGKQVDHCSLLKNIMIVHVLQKRSILRYIHTCTCINLCYYLKGTCIDILHAPGTTLMSVLLKVLSPVYTYYLKRFTNRFILNQFRVNALKRFTN